MPGDRAAPTASQQGRRPFRLRSLLVLAGTAAVAYWAFPRATAAVELQSSAARFADYALCMVGPTGPQLLRDNPGEFKAVVRRRLVGAEPEERPFAACAAAARVLADSEQVAEAHAATAASFVEYGTDAADRAARGSTRELSIDRLRVTTHKLASLARVAWPFSRQGYTRLVVPSLGAHEAVHPVALARPALGRGLPDRWERYRAVQRTRRGYRLAFGTGANLSLHESSDGLSFSAAKVGPRGLDFAERCATDKTSFTFGIGDDTGALELTVTGPAGERRTIPLAAAEHQVFTASCDAAAVTVGLAREDGAPVGFMLCRAAGLCEPLHLPPLGQLRLDSRFVVDVARVDGVTVLSAERHGIVRVTSSRDDGRSWMPYVVAFDRGSDTALAELPVPQHLLVLGARVLLYAGGAEADEVYPVLASDDYGASWRTPAEAAPALAAVKESPSPRP